MKIGVLAMLLLSVIACGAGGASGDAKTPSGSGGSGAGVTSGVPSGSLREQEIWKNLNEEMAGYIKQVNDNCSTTIQGSYDTASYQGKFNEENSGYGVSTYARSSCESLIKSVRDICANDGKARVKTRIQRIECKYGTVGQKPNVQLASGKLTGQFDPEAGGSAMSEATTEFLRKSL